MNQSENKHQRILAIAGVSVFVATVALTFQNCGQGMKMTEPSVIEAGPQGTPTPVIPTPTPPVGGGSGQFTMTSTNGAPAVRCQHASTAAGAQYFVWGGVTPNVTMPQDGGLYNPVANTWTAVTATGAPGPRNFASAVYTGTTVIVWGGSYTSNLDTGGIYNIATNTWTTMGTVGAPGGRFNHAAVWTGSKMIVYGGSFQNGTTETYLNTGGIFDPATNTWAPMTAGPTVSGLNSGVWTGNRFVVFGGGRSNQGGIYDPATNTWAPLPQLGLPGARDAHVVYSNGSKVVVWGGFKLMNGLNYYDNTGGILDLATNLWTSTSTIGIPSGGIDRSIGFSGNRLYTYEPNLAVGAILDISTNTWLPMNVNGGLSARFNHSAGAIGNSLVTWGGCTQAGGVTTGYNTGTVYQ